MRSATHRENRHAGISPRCCNISGRWLVALSGRSAFGYECYHLTLAGMIPGSTVAVMNMVRVTKISRAILTTNGAQF